MYLQKHGLVIATCNFLKLLDKSKAGFDEPRVKQDIFIFTGTSILFENFNFQIWIRTFAHQFSPL